MPRSHRDHRARSLNNQPGRIRKAPASRVGLRASPTCPPCSKDCSMVQTLRPPPHSRGRQALSLLCQPDGAETWRWQMPRRPHAGGQAGQERSQGPAGGAHGPAPQGHREQEESDNPGLWEFKSSRDPSKSYRVTYGRAGHLSGVSCQGDVELRCYQL